MSEEQLGLRLQPDRGPLQIVVIEQIDKPTPDSPTLIAAPRVLNRRKAAAGATPNEPRKHLRRPSTSGRLHLSTRAHQHHRRPVRAGGESCR
jgi:hypothetical protein